MRGKNYSAAEKIQKFMGVTSGNLKTKYTQMKRLLIVILLFAGMSYASAQEVYTSSGKPGYHHRYSHKKKGYDPDKLIIGGGLNAGYGTDQANFGISPIAGYRFFHHFSAGIGLGYQYFKVAVATDPYNPNNLLYQSANIVYPSLWSRYFVFRNFFVDATYEYDFIGLTYPFDNYGNVHKTKLNVTNSCFLLGAGVREPLGGRVSAYVELVYDLLQGRYSPYQGVPNIRFGFAAGF